MISKDTLSIIANVCTIVSSFSIVYALYFYIKNQLDRRKKFNFSNPEKREAYFLALAKNPIYIEKVVIDSNKFSEKNLSRVLINRYNSSNSVDKEQHLKNGLKFFLSDEAIKSSCIFDSSIIDNMSSILNRYCSLALDGENYFTADSRKVDAWVTLSNGQQFSIKFPIPGELCDDKTFNDIGFGKETLSKLGREVIHDYFLPYLIIYVSKSYDELSKEDAYKLISSFWEIGPS